MSEFDVRFVVALLSYSLKDIMLASSLDEEMRCRPDAYLLLVLL